MRLCFPPCVRGSRFPPAYRSFGLRSSAFSCARILSLPVAHVPRFGVSPASLGISGLLLLLKL